MLSKQKENELLLKQLEHKPTSPPTLNRTINQLNNENYPTWKTAAYLILDEKGEWDENSELPKPGKASWKSIMFMIQESQYFIVEELKCGEKAWEALALHHEKKGIAGKLNTMRMFLTLEWNLMARSENVVHAHILHVHWEEDCIVFRFVKSKGDQMGRNHNQEWHVYANPHNPAICPVLALACYIFSNPGVFSVSEDEINDDQEDGEVEAQVGDGAGRPASCKGRLFPGDHQYDRFMGCLHRIIEKYPNEFLHWA